MKNLVAILVLSTSLASPIVAQEAETDQGFSLMEEGARMIMRGLMAEMEPAIDSLRDTVEEMGPAMGEFLREMGPSFAAFLNRIDDIRHYSPPEFLPNGDIILRRKPDAPIWTPDPESGEVEL
ncbi:MULTISPECIES: AAA+ family ATPase [unclassified Yoonia]|uniref:AAA+ family ATPase n=1 Tax=unclassified Yoonia TaxID=2629118 RepID=UPI002AFE55EF|nr:MULTISPECIES: AAA+ family ATPase [unclassified Yoonia]